MAHKVQFETSDKKDQFKRCIQKSATVKTLSTEAFQIGSEIGTELKDLNSTNKKVNFFRQTTSKSKIGLKQLDLLKADNRRR